VQALLDQMRSEPEPLPEETEPNGPEENADIPETYQVVVECADESEQQAVFERLNSEGYKCKLLML
jgi:hypothetical protein